MKTALKILLDTLIRYGIVSLILWLAGSTWSALTPFEFTVLVLLVIGSNL